MRRLSVGLAWGGLALLALLLFPGESAARDPLRCEIKKASEKLRDYFAGRRIKEVTVGDVANADAFTPSTSGPAIRRLLIEELERAELKVKLRAGVAVSVTFRGRVIPVRGERKATELVAELSFTALFARDNSQEDILTFRIVNAEALAHIYGTGFGAPTEMKYTAVQRTIGAVRASAAVRYKVPAGSE